MANLTHLNWPKGYNPSEDAINGDPTALLRMDNLQQEENGALSLVRGQKSLTAGLPDYVFSLYSTTLGGQNPVYAALNEAGRAVVRSMSGNFDDTTTILSDGGFITAYGSALGEVLICCGSQLKKDDGTTVRNLGLLDQATGPKIAIQAPALLDLNTGTWSSIEGHDGGDSGGGDNAWKENVDVTTLRGVIRHTYDAPKDTTAFGDGVTDDYLKDTIGFLCQTHDSANLISIRLQVILDDDPSTPTNYYWNEWDVADGSFNLGQNQQSILGALRQDFVREGSDSSLDWKHVTALQFTATANADVYFLIQPGQVVGGPQGNLNGVYQYCTVAVYDNGTYQAKSSVSPLTNNCLVRNSFTKATLTVTDTQANQVWLFRRSMISSTDPTFQNFINSNQVPANLDQFYLVAQGAPGAVVEDNTSDDDAIEQNITANLFLQSLQDVNDNFVGMEGLYFERMYYVSESNIYLSDRLNPDAVDLRYTVKAFAGNTEKNLWLKKINATQMLLATTKDHYLVTGTGEDLPDGSLDIQITSLGEKYVSLSTDVTSANGVLFYPSADGIRATSGGLSQNISQQLRLLWQGQDRHGVPGISINSQDAVSYALAAGKSKLYCTVPMTDGTRRLFIYDTVLQNWRLRFTDPLSICVTPTDRVIVGYPEQSEGVWELETNDTFSYPFTFLTVFDANGQPRNRKDTFTLKIVADTGGNAVNVQLAKDGGAFEQVGTISGNGPTTFYFPLDAYTLGFRYALQLSDVNLVDTFKLYEYTIEYEPRPEQLDYLRILPTNLGTISRKRFTAYAFVIDTLGNQITFTPYIDNSPVQALVFGTATKLTQIVYFTTETVGTDIGGIFSGGVFEFYQVALEECVSEKLPTPVQFLVIPSNNYGTPNRKRFTSVKFQILTRGQNVTYTPIVDGVSHTSAILNTTTKRTVEYFFPLSDGDVSGIDISGTLSGTNPFEFYGVIVPQQVEQLPDRLTYFVIPQNNYGSPNRKRFSSIKFEINTNSADVIFTPQVDNTVLDPMLVNTSFKRTVFLYFNFDLSGVDVGGTLASSGSVPFEFYQILRPQEVEEIPPLLEYFIIPPTNYGVPNRKRMSSFKFQINTFGHFCSFTPLVDGVAGSPLTFSTFKKQTVEYFYNSDTIGIDFSGTVQSTEIVPVAFEFYEVVTPQQVEKLPDRLEFFVIPANDYGTPNRKRHSSYKFQINTNGSDVLFTPIIDGTSYPTTTFNTSSKKTVEYFFTSDTVGIDIGGTLSGISPFEFYQVVLPQLIEQLPDRLEFYKSPNTNFGIASRKRIRTIPIEIDTYGQPVTFQPIVDGVLLSGTSTLISTGKTTLFHYFSTDVFGTDYGGTFTSAGNQPFEFYGYGQPEDVETLPVAKKYDQLGPVRYDKIGKLFGFRLRLITNGTTVSVPYKLMGDTSANSPTYGTELYTGAIATLPGFDNVYEVQLPKSVNTDIVRLVLGPTTDTFHRYDVFIKFQQSGLEGEAKWERIR